MRTPRDEMAFGHKVVLGVAAVFAVAIVLQLGLPALVLSDAFSGTAINPDRARQIVGGQKQTLQRVLALTQRRPLPSRDDLTCRTLATELGALDIRFEDREEGPWVRITFSRGGVAETYETQLTWVPATAAARVRAGRDRLGEEFEYLDHGWWWVFR